MRSSVSGMFDMYSRYRVELASEVVLPENCTLFLVCVIIANIPLSSSASGIRAVPIGDSRASMDLPSGGVVRALRNLISFSFMSWMDGNGPSGPNSKSKSSSTLGVRIRKIRASLIFEKFLRRIMHEPDNAARFVNSYQATACRNRVVEVWDIILRKFDRINFDSKSMLKLECRQCSLCINDPCQSLKCEFFLVHELSANSRHGSTIGFRVCVVSSCQSLQGFSKRRR